MLFSAAMRFREEFGWSRKLLSLHFCEKGMGSALQDAMQYSAVPGLPNRKVAPDQPQWTQRLGHLQAH